HSELGRPARSGASDTDRGVGALEPDIGQPPVIGRAVDVDVPTGGVRVLVGDELTVGNGQAGREIAASAQHADVVVGELGRCDVVLNAGGDDPVAEVVDIAVEECGAAGVLV